MGDGDLVGFECGVRVVQIEIGVPHPRIGMWGFASRTTFFFLFFMPVPTRVFAFYAGLDGPMPKC